jgi:PAS domain S-box-containing protein
MDDPSEPSTIAVLYVTTDVAHAKEGERHFASHESIELLTRQRVEDAISLVHEADVDCVISDHDLPDTDGIAFLQNVRAQYPDLPFFLFTSEGSEAVASRAISARVTEYLVKDSYQDQWARLADLIADAVRYYRKHTRILDTQHRAETILRASPDTVAIVQDGRFAYVNDAGCDLFGAADETELVETLLEDRLSMDAETDVLDRLAGVRGGDRKLDRFHATIVDLDGNGRPVEATVTQIVWRGEPATLLIARDVTARTEERQQRRLFRRLIDRANDGILVIDPRSGRLLDANTTACESLGYDRESLLELSVPDISTMFDTSEEYVAFVEDAGEEDPPTIEDEHVRADGTTFPVEISGSTVTVDDDAYRIAIARDLTERKERERDLRESRETFEGLFHGINDAVFVHDVDGQFLAVNETARERLGYDEDELLAMGIEDVDASEYVDRGEERIRAIERSGELTFETAHVTASGDRIPVEITSSLVEFHGEAAILSVARDLTERKERDRRLRRYERAVEGSTDMLAATDDENVLLFANERYREFHGLSREDVGEITVPEYLGEEAFAEIKPYLERADRGATVEYETERRGPDGDRRILDVRYYPLEDEDGEVEAVVAAMRDVTERVAVESELRTYEEIVQRVGDPIMLQDLEGYYRVFNDAVAEYAGMDPDELHGDDEFAFMNPEAATRIAKMKARVVETEEPVDYEVRPDLSTKGSRTFATTRYPHYDEDGEIDGTVAICRDVTERRERQRQLKVIDRVLRHNLHNEMNVVMGHAEQILDDPDGDHAASAREILQAGRDLVDLADKERRIVQLLSDDPTLESIQLRPLLTAIVEDLDERHPESRIALDCPRDVRIRAERSLGVALRELIENGVVHNHREHPSVEVTARRDGETVRITVSDDGPGVPIEERLILTGDEEIQPLFHGSGLGLWLVNHVVRRSNGTLAFEEERAGDGESDGNSEAVAGERGTVVTVSLPAT